MIGSGAGAEQADNPRTKVTESSDKTFLTIIAVPFLIC